MLSFDHVTFSYSDRPPVLVDVSLTVSPGEHVMLLGSNGSGKTTIARLANGMVTPGSGTVSCEGIDSVSGNLRELRCLVGVVAQDPESQIVAANLEDEIAFGPENLGLPREEIAARVAEAIDICGLSKCAGREPHMLSGGEKQRLVIAGILAMRPRYIVLDEPGSMLDGYARRDIRKLIRKLRDEGCGILHITHDIAECVGADRVLVLRDGKIAFEGTLTELLERGELLESCGLVPTPMMRLVTRLREDGIAIPDDTVAPSIVAHAVANRGGEGR